MEYVRLYNGRTMPIFGIGTYLLSPDEAEKSVFAALECGYRLIDTANMYANEKAVGRAMKDSGLQRSEIFLETKIWPTHYTDENAIDRTLERLGTDYIDLLLIHQPTGDFISGYRMLEKAYREGKVRSIGLSNFTQQEMCWMMNICSIKPAVLQTELHPYSGELELKKFLNLQDIRIQAWYPLGHGDSKLISEPIFTRLAKKYGKTNAQIILRWHVQEGNIVIPGSKSPDHIRENIDIFDFELTESEMLNIGAIDRGERYYKRSPERFERYLNMKIPFED